MSKKILKIMTDHPLVTSLFITDLAILMFQRPPFFFSFIMMGGLVTMCMYLGQKLAIFK
ncbi:MAG: hypothetical protein ACU833_02310 [Gammaproteobacteria bacterium]